MKEKHGFSLLIKGEKIKFLSPIVMGILNVTPDSFSDGGQFFNPKKAIKRAKEMIKEGAQIIDIGGESTGPGSKEVGVEEELKRIMPIVEYADLRTLRKNNVLISIDTYKPEVAEKVLKEGVDMINDVTALRQGGRAMGELIAKYQAGLVLMYSKDNSPRTTLENKKYKDVVSEIGEFLNKRIDFALSCGIKKEQIIIDPGMGAFLSKDPEPSLEVLGRLKEFKKLGYPILIGASRKGFIGQILGEKPANERLAGSLACSAMAIYNGANIIRAHEVKETVEVIKVVGSL